MTTPPAPFDPGAVPIREAATVALIRDARVGGGVEVFLQHRVPTMQFAAGMSVFPGGGVEPRDYRGTRAWRGPESRWWAGRFAIGEERAAAAVRGVARELFEETGVLLAEPETEPEPTPSGQPGHAERRALDAGEGDLDGLLAQHGLVLSAHLLRPWDRWTTPLGPPRRYDTLFFVAALPEGAEPDAVTSEARAAEWIRAEDAALAGTLGHLGMLRPTLHVVSDLATAANVGEVMEWPRTIAPGGN
ncbi:NUDIX hydrolase [Dietzia aurantiaca]|uniref:NUDIX hydrolase n=1 Tax=Dietzia aurantiaca TaxID=983873 RepID=A0ABV9PSX8_9ACTN